MTTSLQLTKKIGNHKGFLGIFMSDAMPNVSGKDWSLIANYDNSGGPGNHWVAIKCVHGVVTYFDSVGQNPDKDDILLHCHPHFQSWLSQFGKYFVNRVCYQSFDENSCGQWCVMFIVKPNLLKVMLGMPNPDAAVKKWFNLYPKHVHVEVDSIFD